MDQLNQQLWAAVQQGDMDRVTRLLEEGLISTLQIPQAEHLQ